jgi:hypothetical protein
VKESFKGRTIFCVDWISRQKLAVRSGEKDYRETEVEDGNGKYLGNVRNATHTYTVPIL